jgi:hypothetical protein
MKIDRLDHLVLTVRDIEETRDLIRRFQCEMNSQHQEQEDDEPYVVPDCTLERTLKFTAFASGRAIPLRFAD